MNTESRIAVVTGAGQGLGLETCRQLAAKGYAVVVTARTDDSLRKGLDALRTGAQGRVLDVASDDSVSGFYDWLKQRHGRIDVLVNNAGRTFGGWGRDFGDTEPADILEAFDNNTLGAYRMTRLALPMMNAARFGRIVNVSTGMAQLSDMNGGAIPYRLSKTALNALTRVTAAAAGPGVKVNSVCPGWVRTAMGGSSATRELAHGAAGIVWAATLPDDGPTGGFFRDGRPIPW